MQRGESLFHLVLGERQVGVCVRARANCPLHPCSSNAKTFQSTHSKLNIKVFKTKIKSTCYLLVIGGQSSLLICLW